MGDSKRFVSYVSLGWYCGVAASMEKYGLRSFSGPFDWGFSDFRGVLHFLETDFEDFLQRENLLPHKVKGVRDVKYDIHFPHDMNEGMEKEYEETVSRYKKRIERFVQAAKEGVCYIRSVKNKEELQWIVQNQEYIQSIVKKWNSKNDIKYLIPTFIDMPATLPDIKYYVITLDSYKGDSVQVLRSLFNSNEEFVSDCIADMDVSIYKDNLIFELTKGNQKRDQMLVNLTKEGKKKDQTISELSDDVKVKGQTIVELTRDTDIKERTISELMRDGKEKVQKISELMEEVKEKEHYINELDKEKNEKVRLLTEMTQKQEETSRRNVSNEFKYRMLTKLHSMQYSYRKTPREIDIYGVDNVGKILCDTIQRYCKVGCFLDNIATATEYKGIPIKKVKDYVATEGKKVVVTAPNNLAGISDMLQADCGVEKENIISIEEFLKEVRADENDIVISYAPRRGQKRKGWR